MHRKIPSDAFAFYMSLGAERSYQAVAAQYGVSKQAVAKAAIREGWAQRIQEVERKARQRTDEKAVETIEEMTARHLKALRVLMGRALQTLQAMPLGTAMEAARVIDIVIRQERVARGEPSDRQEINAEELMRKEHDLYLRRATDEDWERLGKGLPLREPGEAAPAVEEAEGDGDEPGVQ
ncbi:MAG: hypothetical protein EYC70_07110 [Planctomycetota bacterium]|nr:MAG: hypothetical protein EYC70_07110 [Planctomycetota bacterium]